MSLRDHILGVSDAQVQRLEVPEWGTVVHLRTWTAGERAKFQKFYADTKDSPDFASRLPAVLAVSSVCDEHGNQQFTQDDVEALMGKRASALDRIAEAVLKLNGIGADAVEDAKKN